MEPKQRIRKQLGHRSRSSAVCGRFLRKGGREGGSVRGGQGGREERENWYLLLEGNER